MEILSSENTNPESLDSLRKEIDAINKEMLSLFVRRSEICRKVAAYKKANGLPIYQKDREDRIISSVRADVPNDYADGAELLFTVIMEISKCIEENSISDSDGKISSEFIVPAEKSSYVKIFVRTFMKNISVERFTSEMCSDGNCKFNICFSDKT